MPRVNQLLNWVMGINFLCGIVFLLTIVYEYGFRISASEHHLIHTLYHTVWVIFLVTTTIQIVFRQEDSSFKFTPWTWILTILLYLTLLPVVFKKPEETTGVYWVWVFFHHASYKGTILVLLSFSQLSGILVRLLGKRTNPSLILAGSFLVFILLGTGLLMLPRATYHGISFMDALFTATSATCVTGLVTVDVPSTFTLEGQILIILLIQIGGLHGISFMDALFTATSATCVTGLVTVDVPSTFTLEGQILIILLIQIGGLGVMTLTSFFAMFFMGNTSLYNQLMVGDMISSNSLNSLLSTLLYILGFTLAIEGVGMVVIWLSVHGTLGMTLQEELFFSAFHSVSAFCNAGFSTLPGGMGNPAVMQGHNLLYITLGLLIALGGIGFPILVNLYETVAYYLQAGKFWLLRRSGRFRKKVHLYNLNTKIVLVATVFLLIGGTLAIAALEWNHSFAGMPVADKWVHAFFNSSCPRTAGFASVGLTSLSTQTLLLMVVLMMIGGGTQSTAGGVKVNVFAVVLINLWAVVRGADRVAILRRELSHDSIRRSNAALILYLFMVFLAIFLLSVLEPETGLLAITFECVSALSTVGSSLDLTPTLGNSSKLLVILLMYIGRVGAFTLLTGLVRQEKKRNYRYPSDNIIIN